MFVLKLDDGPRFPPVYFAGFCRDPLCPVRIKPKSDAVRFDDIREVMKVQQEIHDRTPGTSFIIEYVG